MERKLLFSGQTEDFFSSRRGSSVCLTYHTRWSKRHEDSPVAGGTERRYRGDNNRRRHAPTCGPRGRTRQMPPVSFNQPMVVCMLHGHYPQEIGGYYPCAWSEG